MLALTTLLEAGADVNAVPASAGLPALYYAARAHCIPAVRSLLAAPGVEVNMRNFNNESPLHGLFATPDHPRPRPRRNPYSGGRSGSSSRKRSNRRRGRRARAGASGFASASAGGTDDDDDTYEGDGDCSNYSNYESADERPQSLSQSKSKFPNSFLQSATIANAGEDASSATNTDVYGGDSNMSPMIGFCGMMFNSSNGTRTQQPSTSSTVSSSSASHRSPSATTAAAAADCTDTDTDGDGDDVACFPALKLLLEARADPNHRDSWFNRSALHLAALSPAWRGALPLLALHGADPTVPSGSRGREGTPAVAAAQRGDLVTLAMLAISYPNIDFAPEPAAAAKKDASDHPDNSARANAIAHSSVNNSADSCANIKDSAAAKHVVAREKQLTAGNPEDGNGSCGDSSSSSSSSSSGGIGRSGKAKAIVERRKLSPKRGSESIDASASSNADKGKDAQPSSRNGADVPGVADPKGVVRMFLDSLGKEEWATALLQALAEAAEAAKETCAEPAAIRVPLTKSHVMNQANASTQSQSPSPVHSHSSQPAQSSQSPCGGGGAAAAASAGKSGSKSEAEEHRRAVAVLREALLAAVATKVHAVDSK